jgi:hypothetical protein
MRAEDSSIHYQSTSMLYSVGGLLRPWGGGTEEIEGGGARAGVGLASCISPDRLPIKLPVGKNIR